MITCTEETADARLAPLEITTDVSEQAWDQFVDAHPQASGYHAWRWRRVFEAAFGHETCYLAARRGGAIAGVLPVVVFRSRLFGRFAVSLPFVNYGGVCAADPEAAAELVARARALAVERRLAHVELRHVGRQFAGLPARQHKVGMTLALADTAERAWQGLDRKVRNQVRKAEKSGLTAQRGGAELVDRFYAVFAQNMHDLGTPVYPVAFFRQILERFPDRARIFLVDHGETTVGGALTLAYRDTIEVPSASSLRAYHQQCPNNLLYWRIIEHAIASGLKRFDFGRSTPDEGTFHFKRQWGAQPEPLHWEYVLLDHAELPTLDRGNSRFKLAIAAWKRLPVPMTNWLGPRLVRSIP